MKDLLDKRHTQVHSTEPNLTKSLNTHQQSSFDAYNSQGVEGHAANHPKRGKADTKLSSKQETVQMQKKIKQLISNVSF